MTIKVARKGDTTIGTCSVHGSGISGTISTGSPDTYVNGIQVARLTDTITATCGHTATISTSSTVTFANNLGVARVGDTGSGVYTCTIISGSEDTFTT